MDKTQKLYKPAELARIWEVTVHTIHNWIKRGKLKAVTMPRGRKLIEQKELNRFVSESED
jgi:predicted site-specific integrase-resolvase